MQKLIFILLVVLEVSLLSSCQSAKQVNASSTSDLAPTVTSPEKPEATQCKSPRSAMCTKEYRPVCATKDTGERCVTTPCPSSEQVTKSNACTACADEKVSSYVAGACS